MDYRRLNILQTYGMELLHPNFGTVVNWKWILSVEIFHVSQPSKAGGKKTLSCDELDPIIDDALEGVAECTCTQEGNGDHTTFLLGAYP